MGKSETALNLIKKRPVSPEYLSVPFFDYFLGEIYLQKGKYAEASNAYQDFIRNQRGFNFLKEANYKIFLCHDLNNEGKIDTKYLYNALKVGETIVEPDKIALKATQQILKTNTSISPTEKKLKKIQLATEGGYYQEGLALLEKMDESSMPKLKDRVEKIYREGRIYHLMGNTETAMVKYEKVLLLSPVQPVWSYIPRSCLYIGNIKQLQNDKKKAIYFYKKTLEYEDYEGSNGVEIKAKAGLNELQQ
jgi:tetratricopeptide (TPR) repeat protein